MWAAAVLYYSILGLVCIGVFAGVEWFFDRRKNKSPSLKKRN